MVVCWVGFLLVSLVSCWCRWLAGVAGVAGWYVQTCINRPCWAFAGALV